MTEQKVRKIIHVDMDCFYAAVEMRDDPSLKDKPIAVGGSGARSVLCTSNYNARSYGVRSAMPAYLALKKCPDLVIIRPTFSKYKDVSQKVREIFYEYTDKVQPLSLDEAYLDVTHSESCFGSATMMAQEIRQKISDQLDLSASAGVASNKFLSKVASDWNKPNGLFVITPEYAEKFVYQLEVSKIPGVGKVLVDRLLKNNIKYCSDLHKYSLSRLSSEYGKMGEILYHRSRGVDPREVESYSKAKSISVEHTFLEDLCGKEELKQRVPYICEELIERLQRSWSKNNSIEKFRPYKIQVKIKYSDFSVQTREMKIPKDIELTGPKSDLSKKQLVRVISEFNGLIDAFSNEKLSAVRLLGLGFKTKDRALEKGQISIFPNNF